MPSYDTRDLDHLLDLLELLPWEPSGTGETDRCEVPSELRALDTNRWNYVVNMVIDYGPARAGNREDSLIYRLAMYTMNVFDGVEGEAARVIGELVTSFMFGVDVDEEAMGQRWCANVSAAAWRILVPYVAANRRSARAATYR